MVELQNQGKKNCGHRNSHHYRQVAKAVYLLGLLSTNDHRISRRQRCLKCGEFRHGSVEHLRGESTINRSAFDTDGSKVLLAPNLLELQPVLNRGNLEQRNPLRALGRIHIKILDIRELRPLGGTKPGHDRDLFIPFTKCRDLRSAQGSGRRMGHICVGDAGEVGAVGINLQPDRSGLLAPIIVNASGGGYFTENVFDLSGKVAKSAEVLSLLAGRNICLIRNQNLNWLLYRIRLQLLNLDTGSSNFLAERSLQGSHEIRHVVLVFYLHDDLGVIQLLNLRGNGQPKSRPATAVKSG